MAEECNLVTLLNLEIDVLEQYLTLGGDSRQALNLENFVARLT